MTDIPLSTRCMVLLMAVMVMIMGGCNTKNLKIYPTPDIAKNDASTLSYIFNVGRPHVRGVELWDFAFVSAIKSDNFELDIEHGKFGNYSVSALLAGQYQITIEYYEKEVCIWDFDGCFPYNQDKPETLILTVMGDRLYVPYVDDECGRNWAWIEDWGSAIENGAPEFSYLSSISMFPGGNPIGDPSIIVAGEKPPDEC